MLPFFRDPTFDACANAITVTGTFQVSEIQSLYHCAATALVQAITIIHIDYSNNITACAFYLCNAQVPSTDSQNQPVHMEATPYHTYIQHL